MIRQSGPQRPQRHVPLLGFKRVGKSLRLVRVWRVNSSWGTRDWRLLPVAYLAIPRHWHGPFQRIDQAVST